MGSTYVLPGIGITNGNLKNYIAISNQSGSGKNVRIWRVYIQNAQTAGITGGNTIANIGRFVGSYSGGTTLTPISMNSSNPAFPSQIVCATGATGITLTNLFFRICLFTDEFAVGDATSDMLTVIPGLSLFLDLGYYNSNLQPFIISEGEGFVIQHAGTAVANNNTAGSFNFLIEFDLI